MEITAAAFAQSVLARDGAGEGYRFLVVGGIQRFHADQTAEDQAALEGLGGGINGEGICLFRNSRADNMCEYVFAVSLWRQTAPMVFRWVVALRGDGCTRGVWWLGDYLLQRSQ